MKCLKSAVLGVVLTAGLPMGHARAQEKPDPTPIDNRPRLPDIEAFKVAYERAQAPRILVMCAADGRYPRFEQPAASGNVAPGHFAGAGGLQSDRAGDAESLQNEIERLLLQDKDVELVNLDAVAEQDRHDFDLLRQRNEESAVQLMASKFNADLVIVVRMLHSPEVVNRGAKYRVNYELLLPSRGRKIGGYSFDWREGLGAEMIKQYASALTRRIFDDFCSWYAPDANGAAANYSVRLTGLTDLSQLKTIMDEMQKLPGVARVRAGETAFGTDTSVCAMTVRYSGRTLDLMSQMQDVGGKKLSMVFKVTASTAGTMTFNVSQAPNAQVQNNDMWIRLVNPNHPNHETAAALLTSAYTNSSKPTIAVIVNREFDPKDPANAALANVPNPSPGAPAAAPGDRGVLVTINMAQAQGGGFAGAGNGGAVLNPIAVPPPGPNTDDVIDTRRMEDYLFKRLVRMGLSMKDSDVARNGIMQQADKAQKVFREDELADLLKRSKVVDVIILGIGRMEHRFGKNSLLYTFRVVRVADGAVLGADGYSLDIPPGKAIADTAVENTADYIAGHLAEQMMSFWQPPRLLTVKLFNAKTPRDVSAIMSVMQDKMPKVLNTSFQSFETGTQGGIGQFQVQYNDSIDNLIKEISRLGSDLPFDLDTHTIGKDELAIKLRDGV